MRIIKTKIQDLVIIKQRNNIDNRGSLRETFNNKILKKNLFLSTARLQKKMFYVEFIFSQNFNRLNM